DPFEPDDPDSAEFNINSFAIGPDNTAYITSTIVGAVVACTPSGGVKWAFYAQDPYADEFYASPVVADDGTIFASCLNEFIYALNANGTVKWSDSIGSAATATGALGADGTAYFQTEDSMVIALRSDGSTAWTFFTGGGNSAPVVGADGTVYAVNQDGIVYAINPDSGSQKWATSPLGPTVQAPAINPDLDTMYVTTESGLLQALDVATGAPGWSLSVGADASGPVIGPDGSVYVSGSGRLLKLSPQLDSIWSFFPPLFGVLSTPAVTVDGYVYVLATAGKKRLAMQDADTLYAVNPDGSRRWGCGLGEGVSDPEFPLSAPKLDAGGSIYVGNGLRAWCVAGISAPAQSVWPMMYHDAQNTGRAR
ncbi:PQQ-like beta-propeller repeat protein, partial [candidate division WOR-3 bacterium]|nr:PQQ-like beta-propeller repeat protein [candidate division WOR-3 bacterium]